MARPYTNFGKLVSETLTSRGLTREEFSNRTGVSTSYLSQCLTGKKNPSSKYVEKMADGLDLTPPERREMHYRAAIESGFKLDLTKDDELDLTKK